MQQNYMAIFLLAMVAQRMSSTLYQRMVLPASIWPSSIFKDANPAKSVIECGLQCTLNVRCDGFKFTKPESCFLADFKANSDIIGIQQNEGIMHIDKGKMKNGLYNCYAVADGWFNRATSTKEVLATSTDVGCIHECTFVQDANCGFYVYDPESEICYFGLSTMQNSSTDPKNKSWSGIELCVKKTFASEVAAKVNEMQKASQEFPISKWNQHVYVENSPILSRSDCGVICILDLCHFYVHFGDTCYLGQFTSTNNTSNILSGNVEVYLNSESLGTYVNSGMIESSAFYHKYVIQEILDTPTENVCKLHCIHGPKCHYVTFDPVTSTCSLGFLAPETPLFQFRYRGALRTFILQEKMKESSMLQYFSNPSQDNNWSTQVLVTKIDVKRIEVCAALTILSVEEYNMFSYEASSKNCHLGVTLSYESSAPLMNASTIFILQRSILVTNGVTDAAGAGLKTEQFDIQGGRLCESYPYSAHDVRGAASGLLGGAPIICGGYVNGSAYSKVCTFIGHSEPFVTMNEARGWPGGISLNGTHFLVTGGSDGVNWFSSSEIISLDGKVSTGPDLPMGMHAACMTKINKDAAILLGGIKSGGQTRFSSAWFFNLNTLSWTPGPSMSVVRSEPTCGSYTHNGNTYVVVTGGWTDEGLGLKVTEILHILPDASLTWVRGPDFPFGIAGSGRMLTERNKVIVIGGFSGDFATPNRREFLQLTCNGENCTNWNQLSMELSVGRNAFTALSVPGDFC